MDKWSVGRGSNGELITHKNSPSKVKRDTGLSDLSSYFGDAA